MKDVKKKYLETLKPHEINERKLWHGTNDYNLRRILNGGFRQEYSKRHFYGYGTYFAVSPAVSSEYAIDDSDPGIRRLLYCDVLVGRYYLGKQSDKTPVPIHEGALDTYESRANIRYQDVVNPSTVFVTCDNNGQALPKILIEYTVYI